MGLMDVLNGIMNGPRGQPLPSRNTGGGMSPLTMGLLALLAYKAFKGGGILSSNADVSHAYTPTGVVKSPERARDADWLGGLGRMIAGGAAGGILTGGL